MVKEIAKYKPKNLIYLAVLIFYNKQVNKLSLIYTEFGLHHFGQFQCKLYHEIN